jgi:chromate transport protein ChrA
VVAQAIWGMANSLTPDRARAAIALAAVAIVVFIGGSFGQIGAIVLGPSPGSGCAAAMGLRLRATSAFLYRAGTAQPRSCCSRSCSCSRRW